jgi:hypothetical protein
VLNVQHSSLWQGGSVLCCTPRATIDHATPLHAATQLPAQPQPPPLPPSPCPPPPQGDAAPETSADFEALLLSSPNASLVWIKYMAFLITLGDVDKARQVAERALATIHYREEQVGGELVGVIVLVVLPTVEGWCGTAVRVCSCLQALCDMSVTSGSCLSAWCSSC